MWRIAVRSVSSCFLMASLSAASTEAYYVTSYTNGRDCPSETQREMLSFHI